MTKVFTKICRNFKCSPGEKEATHGSGVSVGRTLDRSRAPVAAAQEKAAAESRAKTNGSAEGPCRHSFRSSHWHPLGVLAAGDGVRDGDELLAVSAQMAKGWGLGKNPQGNADQTAGSQQDRLDSQCCRQRVGASSFWGAETGPNPTDRAKNGSKHHLIADGQGIPLSVILTGANTHDVTQILPLVESIPPVPGHRGRPRQRPDCVIGDRGYDSEKHRQALRDLRITPVLAQRRTEHGSGLGKVRWVIERSISWLRQFRRLRIRYEKRADIHRAFLFIGCALICWRFL